MTHKVKTLELSKLM